MSACGLGVSFAVVLILLVWDRFQSTPTITTIETNNYPIWNVPVSPNTRMDNKNQLIVYAYHDLQFPAVTLCNINKVHRPATMNITEKL